MSLIRTLYPLNSP